MMMCGYVDQQSLRNHQLVNYSLLKSPMKLTMTKIKEWIFPGSDIVKECRGGRCSYEWLVADLSMECNLHTKNLLTGCFSAIYYPTVLYVLCIVDCTALCEKANM